MAPLNLPATMPEHASELYARNVLALLELMLDESGAVALNFDDEVLAGACVTRQYAKPRRTECWCRTLRCWCWPASSASR